MMKKWVWLGVVLVVSSFVAAQDYLVIDLSGGPSASSYPVSYYDDVTAGGWTDEYKTTKLVLRRIPAGTFTMGSPSGEMGRWINERQRSVTLTKDFYIGVFQVTQKQWERVMGDWPSYFNNTDYRDSRPVEQVSWEDIRGGTWPGNPSGSGEPGSGTFIERISSRTGFSFDLPTEAQWEYACRAGTTTALNSDENLTREWGSCSKMDEVGRYRNNHPGGYSSSSSVSPEGGTAKAGSHLPNAWGLYDMHGNVYEWCLDWHIASHHGLMDPIGPLLGMERVLRGGSWESDSWLCRSACRIDSPPSRRCRSIGIRLSKMLPVGTAGHTLTVVNGSGEGLYVTGKAVAVMAEAAPHGQVFSHWTVEPSHTVLGMDFDASSKFTTIVMPWHDVILTAHYGSDYLVIDLSGGPDAETYPVSYYNDVPSGGWTDEYKTTKLVLRRIPAGTFTMGSPEDELGRLSDEAQRQVTLTKDFYMGVFQVTQKQWERVMGDWPSWFNNTSYRESRPVECVSWQVVRGGAWPGNPSGSGEPGSGTFIERISSRTGFSFDLPTEAQWEYACRAGTTTALNSGKNLTDTDTCPNMAEVGRYLNNHPGGYSNSASVSPDGGTAKAGSYLPNAWELYDMHGNVLEWCLDSHAASPPGAVDPVGAIQESIRVLRGGSWELLAGRSRSAFRSTNNRYSWNAWSGFRLSKTLPVGSAGDTKVRVTNVTVAQQPGTKLVQTTYDLVADTPTVTVSLEVRNGDTVLPASSLTGDIGSGVTTGIGKAIFWDAGVDWSGHVAGGVTFTVTADDGEGESGIPAGGDPTATSWQEVNERWVKNIYADGAITMSDRDTGLMWVFDASVNGTANWPNAIAHCNNLTYAGHSDWFLPNRWRLHAMYGQKALFSNVQNIWHWSSTPNNFGGGGWIVNMNNGTEGQGNYNGTHWVWPCRTQ